MSIQVNITILMDECWVDVVIRAMEMLNGRSNEGQASAWNVADTHTDADAMSTKPTRQARWHPKLFTSQVQQNQQGENIQMETAAINRQEKFDCQIR
jgi:hypothetical protein